VSSARPTLILCAFLISLTALAQPGLCPCWLMLDVRHPHPDGQAEQEHGHGYLNDLFSAGTPAIVTLSLAAAHTLIAMLALGGLWRSAADETLPMAGWILTLEPPPPRRFASFSLSCNSTHP
jgi:hypothetical protein